MIAPEKFVDLTPNVRMPMIGIGTWQMTDPSVLHLVLDTGLGVGYRLIDTASSYGNETTIGNCLKDLLSKYSLKREDIFITTKLKPSDHGSGKAYQAGLESLKRLQIDYIDLYIIHWPGVSGMSINDDQSLKKIRKETWLDLERLQTEGKVRAIGVSNYMINHLEEMQTYATIKPALNQCEFHPHLVQPQLMNYCKSHDIHFQAYSSLGTAANKQKLFDEPVIVSLASKYNCSMPQLLLAWAICQGVSVLPKTSNPDHVISNFKAQNIQLATEDIDKMSKLSNDSHYCWNPLNVK